MARLPTPGADNNSWGDILNEFLGVEHNADGTLKANGSLGAKANDLDVVHNTGSEQIAGAKTFQSSPIVPAPTLGNHASTKAYVDSTVSAGVPDATTSNKGIVQLAGDLAGTAATPTVPGLAGKEPAIVAGLTTQYYRGDKTFQTLDKAAVGLANVDNTSDANKPISSATSTALSGKANTSHTHVIADVTSLQASLDAKANLASPTFTGTVTVPAPANPTDATTKTYVDNAVITGGTPDADATTKGKLQLTGDLGGTAASPTVPGLANKQSSDADLTAIAALAPPNDDFLQRKAGAWTNRTPVQVKTDLSLTKSDVGLSNVDNTSDLTKNSATVTLTNKTIVQPIIQGSSVIALIDSATIATDASLGNIFTVTLGGNRTMSNPTSPANGQKLTYRAKQDGVGSRTLAWASAFRFGLDVPSPILTLTASKTDYIGFIYNGSDSVWDCVAVSRGY